VGRVARQETASIRPESEVATSRLRCAFCLASIGAVCFGAVRAGHVVSTPTFLVVDALFQAVVQKACEFFCTIGIGNLLPSKLQRIQTALLLPFALIIFSEGISNFL